MEDRKKIIFLISLVSILLVIGIVGVFYFTQLRNSVDNNISDNINTINSDNMSDSNEEPVIAQVSLESLTSGDTNESTVDTANQITNIVVHNSLRGVQAFNTLSMQDFSTTDSNLFFTVILDNQSQANKALLRVRYVGDGSTIGPVSSTVANEQQRKFATFSMVAPQSGWPTGEYEFEVITDTGSSSTDTFLIR